MKEKYLEVKILIILFETQDVVTASGLINSVDDSRDVMGDDPYGGF